ncbi:MAG: phage portal protein, partial [Clostridia bacterium]|nr:phage portal protein [Clostridia bacterium]
IPRDIKIVDADTLKFFYDTILRANGTPLAILNGDYTKAQKEAYYEHALEGDIKNLGQAISRVIFSDRQTSFGNEIILYPNAIEFMAMTEKISALSTGLPAGIFTRNEARALLGYPPIENGDEIPQGYNNVINGTQPDNISKEKTE